MFIFYRDHRSQNVEIFTIMASSEIGNGERFGEPFTLSVSPDDKYSYYEIGKLTLVFVEKEVQYLIAFKNGLSNDEQEKLYRQIDFLAGKVTHKLKNESELEAGLFVHDILID